MVELAIRPHDGVGPISLGVSRKEVATVLDASPAVFRNPDDPNRTYDLFSTFETCVYYKGDPEVVELVSIARSGGVSFTLQEVDIFSGTVNEVIKSLGQANSVVELDGGCTYVLVNVDVALHRLYSEQKRFQRFDIGERGYFSNTA